MNQAQRRRRINGTAFGVGTCAPGIGARPAGVGKLATSTAKTPIDGLARESRARYGGRARRHINGRALSRATGATATPKRELPTLGIT